MKSRSRLPRNYVAVSPKKLTDARQLHLGNANDNRDDNADDKDRGNAERVRPHVDEAYDKYGDNPDHCYRGKGEQIKSPPYP